MHGLDENVLKAECFNFFMMGMPWFRQGKEYRSGQLDTDSR